MGNGGSMTKHITKAGKAVKQMSSRMSGSGMTQEVFDVPSVKATETLRNIRVAKPRLPKKYITFE